MKILSGPFKVIWILGDKEATQEEVIEYIKQRRIAEQKERERFEYQNRNLGRSQDTVRLA
jgi:hypothetical protein